MKDVEDGIEPDGIKEFIEEASDLGSFESVKGKKIKRAGGGVAYMLGE
jgi:hypothetical protein